MNFFGAETPGDARSCCKRLLSSHAPRHWADAGDALVGDSGGLESSIENLIERIKIHKDDPTLLARRPR
jgi:hypothetical protein